MKPTAYYLGQAYYHKRRGPAKPLPDVHQDPAVLTGLLIHLRTLLSEEELTRTFWLGSVASDALLADAAERRDLDHKAQAYQIFQFIHQAIAWWSPDMRRDLAERAGIARP